MSMHTAPAAMNSAIHQSTTRARYSPAHSTTKPTAITSPTMYTGIIAPASWSSPWSTAELVAFAAPCRAISQMAKPTPALATDPSSPIIASAPPIAP